MSEHATFADLIAVMARLRAQDGCPWDREQTLASLRTYLLEETHELLEAIDSGDPKSLKEELGDLLLEVVFLAQICSEAGIFGIDDVVTGIRDKLVRRHPHVFGGQAVTGADQALMRWEEIKNQEKSGSADASLLSGVPAAMPALLRAHRLSTKASLAGFDWKRIEDIYQKMSEELGEFQEAAGRGDAEAMAGELGDLLFATANLARRFRIDPEIALQQTNRKFIERFQFVEEGLRRLGISPGQATLEEMDALWDEAKKAEAARGPQSTSSR